MRKFERLRTRTTPRRAVAPLLRLRVERTTHEMSYLPFISRRPGLIRDALFNRAQHVEIPAIKDKIRMQNEMQTYFELWKNNFPRFSYRKLSSAIRDFYSLKFV